MIEINKIIKSNKAIICFVAFVLICIPLFSCIISGKSFSPSPSHIVLAKWYCENGRRKEIVFSDIEKETLVHTELQRIPFSQTKLIIETNNLRFSLFSKGKIIFKNTNNEYEGYGKQTHIIDISDLKKGSELCLFLSPVKNKKGRIESDILLSSEYDYILETLCKSKSIIVLLFALIISSVVLIIIGIIRLFQKKKTAPRTIYLSCCLIVLGIIIFAKNDIAYFIFSNSIAVNSLLFSAYSLLGVLVSSFVCSTLKISSKIITVFNSAIIAYSVLRAVLFFEFLIPFSNAIIISHILLALSFILPIILKVFRVLKDLDIY